MTSPADVRAHAITSLMTNDPLCVDCASCTPQTASCRTSVGLELSIAALARAQVSRGRVVAVATPLHPDAPEREDLDGAEVHRLPMAMAHVPGAYADRDPSLLPSGSGPAVSRVRSPTSSAASARTSSTPGAGSSTACSAPLAALASRSSPAHTTTARCAPPRSCCTTDAAFVQDPAWASA